MLLLDTLQDTSLLLPLADAAIKSALILAAAAGLTFALRQASASARHLVWTCALAATLIVPIGSLAMPRWEVPLLTVAASAPLPDPAPAVENAATARMSEQMQARLQEASSEGLREQHEATPSPGTAGVSITTLLVSIWALGSLVLLGRLLLGIAAVWWMSRRTPIATGARWLPIAREIAADLGLSRVTFRRSERSTMPMTWGVMRPSVVMPAEADEWPDDRARIVLLHELAHVRRADCLTHLLAHAACAIHWMNPLAWLAARRLRVERERACDDLVLACGTPGPDYADQLLTIARTMRTGRLSAAGATLAMARRSQLEGRLMSILDPSVPRTGVSRTRVALATVVAAVAIVPLASLQTWAYESAVVPPRPPSEKAAATSADTPGPQSQGAPPNPVRTEGVVRGAIQGSIEGSIQGSIQGATQGVVQGVAQGVTQGVAQGVVHGVRGGVLAGLDWSQVVSEALTGTLGQLPNPNPNPNPNQETTQKSKADPKVVAALTEALKDSDKEVRESAMQALVHLRDPGIFDPLVVALKDSSADVRESAAFGLGQLRDKRAVAPLTAALKDADAGVREQAVFALGQLRDPSSVDSLIAALRDENPSVREQAAFALGQLRDERAVAPLTAALKDSSADVREQTAFALGQLRARSAVDPLIGALKDQSNDVREQAAFALGQIGDPRAIDALSAALKDANADVRQQAAFALGQLAR